MTSAENNKFDGSMSHRRAILHMIGQAISVFREMPTTADVAAWMNVTKPTAKRYLDKMLENGELIIIVLPYRSNAVIHRWSLSEDVWYQYRNRMLRFDYRMYAQRVMKVTLQDG